MPEIKPTDEVGVLNILLVDENIERARAISDALDSSRYRIAHIAQTGLSILKQVDDLKPDMIVMDIESPDRDVLDSLHLLSSVNPKPIVMFAEKHDSDTIQRSVKSGVSAYVTGNINPERVRAILDAAVARFDEFQAIKQELLLTQQQLASRKTIDQAKRLLMHKQGLSEQDAFSSMRKMAMDSGQKLEQIAATLLTVLKNLP
ncbi:ANTAR domain-containing response regulator [Glaciecola siphonariae]|uniref:ANTAR domain-containing response regulator n=1 Tax=Glaciecola siphonariae TaxID=521012 RepID=A0ABV9LVX2_9ALTE